MKRLFSVAGVLLAPSLLLAQELDGTYEVRMIAPGSKRVERHNPETTPPGQMRRFFIQGSRWAMMDMLVGFQGTLKRNKEQVVLTVLEGPSGPLKKRETLVFLVTAKRPMTLAQHGSDKSRLVLVRTSGKVPVRLPY